MVVGAGQHERDKMYFINDAEFWEGFISILFPSCIDLIFISKPPRRGTTSSASMDQLPLIKSMQINVIMLYFFNIVSLRQSY